MFSVFHSYVFSDRQLPSKAYDILTFVQTINAFRHYMIYDFYCYFGKATHIASWSMICQECLHSSDDIVNGKETKTQNSVLCQQQNGIIRRAQTTIQFYRNISAGIPVYLYCTKSVKIQQKVKIGGDTNVSFGKIFKSHFCIIAMYIVNLI